MNIIETLVIEQEDGLFFKLSDEVPFTHIKEYEIPIYRLQVDHELVIMIYRLTTGKKIPFEILDNLFPYIRRILVLASGESIDQWQFPEELMTRINNGNGEVLKFLILLSEIKDSHDFKKDILQKGLEPEKFTRLIYCNPTNRDMIKQTWKLIWGRFSENT